MTVTLPACSFKVWIFNIHTHTHTHGHLHNQSFEAVCFRSLETWSITCYECEQVQISNIQTEQERVEIDAHFTRLSSMGCSCFLALPLHYTVALNYCLSRVELFVTDIAHCDQLLLFRINEQRTLDPATNLFLPQLFHSTSNS